MVGRRGFLAGCMAVLAAPLGVFPRLREKPTIITMYTESGFPPVAVHLFSDRVAVVTNGREWDVKETGTWTLFTIETVIGNQGFHGQIRLRRVDKTTIDIDHFILVSPYRYLPYVEPQCLGWNNRAGAYYDDQKEPAASLESLPRLMNKLYAKLKAQA
jgi:hypothetical protein